MAWMEIAEQWIVGIKLRIMMNGRTNKSGLMESWINLEGWEGGAEAEAEEGEGDCNGFMQCIDGFLNSYSNSVSDPESLQIYIMLCIHVCYMYIYIYICIFVKY